MLTAEPENNLPDINEFFEITWMVFISIPSWGGDVLPAST